jgi:hypothetical protein
MPLAPGARKNKYAFVCSLSSQSQLPTSQNLLRQSFGTLPRDTRPTPALHPMLAPPRVGEMAAYASLRQDSLGRATIVERRSSRFFRHSLQRLSRFVDRRHGRSQALSNHGLGITIDSSYSSTSDAPTDSEFGEVQSVTTLGSGKTLNNSILNENLYGSGKEHVLLVLSPGKFPHLISGAKAELALRPPLQRNGIDVSQVDINLRNAERISCCRQKGIIELPKAIRKTI